jgi:hypothetical protein
MGGIPISVDSAETDTVLPSGRSGMPGTNVERVSQYWSEKRPKQPDVDPQRGQRSWSAGTKRKLRNISLLALKYALWVSPPETTPSFP